MTVVHIGCEKTGTKSIQYWLRDHEALLAEHGMRFPRGWLRLNVHQELPLCLMRLDRLCMPRELGDEWRDAAWRADVLDQISTDLAEHADANTILSSENLDLLRYDDEFEALRNVVGDAEIIVYLREPATWLAALTEQYTGAHKSGPRVLSSDPEAFDYLGPGTWRVEYDTLLEGWRRWFSTVTVVDYDAVTASEGSVLPSFLRALDLPIVDTDYALNRRGDPMPRAEGNRALGLRFGVIPAGRVSDS